MSPMQPGSPQAQMRPGEDALIRRIQETERTMREFLPSVALSIKPAMDDIRAQQATLADQVAAIAALVGAQVSGDTATTYVAGLPLNATRQSVAAVSVNVPAGFSVARVMAISTLSVGSSAIDCITRIQGNDGGVVTAGYGFAASSHAITLTGLSGGTITASTLAASWPDTSGRANTTLFAVFLR